MKETDKLQNVVNELKLLTSRIEQVNDNKLSLSSCKKEVKDLQRKLEQSQLTIRKLEMALEAPNYPDCLEIDDCVTEFVPWCKKWGRPLESQLVCDECKGKWWDDVIEKWENKHK